MIEFRKLVQSDANKAFDTQEKTIDALQYARELFITTTLDEFKAMINKGDSIGLFVNSELIGYVLNYRVAVNMINQTAVLDTVLVREDYQGNGLGKLLTGYAINYFQRCGLIYETSCNKENVISYRNLTKAGFVDVDRKIIVEGEERSLLIAK